MRVDIYFSVFQHIIVFGVSSVFGQHSPADISLVLLHMITMECVEMDPLSLHIQVY
jgi:hypothetical protein